MKNKQGILISFIVLILIAALYRIMPRPWGFAPQIAMALFGGAVISDKRLAFALPILSMFISDLIYHLLYTYGNGVTPGFYEGQLTNYILFALLTVLGFVLRDLKVWKLAVQCEPVLGETPLCQGDPDVYSPSVPRDRPAIHP